MSVHKQSGQSGAFTPTPTQPEIKPQVLRLGWRTSPDLRVYEQEFTLVNVQLVREVTLAPETHRGTLLIPLLKSFIRLALSSSCSLLFPAAAD